MGPEAKRAAVLGAGVGLAGALLAWAFDIGLRGLGFGLDGLVRSHATNPLVWLADFAPIGLAWLGTLTGAAADRARDERKGRGELEDAARRGRRYHKALSALMDGVVIERAGVIEEANAAAGRILGLPEASLVGEPLERFVPGLKQERAGVQQVHATGAGEVVGIAWRYPGRDAEDRPFDAEVASTRLEGERVMHVIRDVTEERRERERQREISRALVEGRDRAQAQNDARRAFLAGIGHELRTPLTSMLGYLDLIDEDLAERAPESMADVRRLRSSTEQVRELVDKLHDQSMLEAGRLSLLLVPVDLGELVGECRGTVEPLIRAGRSTLEVEVAPELRPVRADRARLRQVLVGLLTNAARFTVEGVVRVRVQPGGTDREPTVLLAVADTGRGMPPEQVERLFEPFEGRRPGRTGLGTAIAHELVRLMGGTLTVESTLGQGTTFRLELPCATDSLKVEQWVQPRARIGAGRVLLLGDDPHLRASLDAELGSRGHQVVAAPSSEAAIEVADALPLSAVIVDCGLLRSDVWTELALIAAHPACATLPVVLLATRDDRALAVRLGGVQALPPERHRLQQRAAALGDRQAPVLALGARGATRPLQEEGWEVRELDSAEAVAQALDQERAGLLVVDLLSDDARGLRLLLGTSELPPVLGLLPSPPTDTDRAAADAAIRGHVESVGDPRDAVFGRLHALLGDTGAT